MSKNRVFWLAVFGILSQEHASVGYVRGVPGFDRAALYRLYNGPNGVHCPLGWVARSKGIMLLETDDVEEVRKLLGLSEEYDRLLVDLRDAHDFVQAIRGAAFRDNFMANAREVAERHGITWAP